MKRFVILTLLISFFLFGCKQDLDGPDDDLIGTWTDTNTEYKFKDDLTYELKYLRAGVQPSSIFNDSVYGEYVIDHARKNLTFNLKGYVQKDGTIVDTSLNSTTWNYEIVDGGNTLKYESSTTLGSMKRVK